MEITKDEILEVKLEADEKQIWITKDYETINIFFGSGKIKITGWTTKPIVKKTLRIDK